MVARELNEQGIMTIKGKSLGVIQCHGNHK